MQRFASPLVALTLALAGAACSAEEDAGSGSNGTVAASTCSFKQVKTQTGPDSACGGTNAHVWPIGMAATDCHGWAAEDTSGEQHYNSANQIQCKADGSFTFTQYPGNIHCTGTGEVKTFALGVCSQDIPPNLYTKAVDLTCCSDPSAAACTAAVPSVAQAGATIYLNGKQCL